MSIGLVILNKNESLGVEWLIPRLPRDVFDCVFAVDGFSTDDSALKLKAAGIEVHVQGSNGRGAAFKLAFEEAIKRKLDGLCFISSDGNEDPSDLKSMYSSLRAGSDICIGSRMMAGAVNEEDISWFRPRKLANKFFAVLGWLSFGLKRPYITDPINGYRGLSTDAWARLAIDSDGFGIEYESSLKAYVLGLRVDEFPTREGERVGGKSTATPIRATKAMVVSFGNAVKFRFRYMRKVVPAQKV